MSKIIRCAYWIPMMFLFAAGGCGSDSDSGGVLSEKQVVKLCDQLITEVESDSSADQLAALEEISITVSEYSYGTAHPPPVPPPPDIDSYVLEPDDPPHLYRMIGILALGNGNRSAALWASLQAARSLPSQPAALSQVGVILTDMERCEDAEKLLRTAKHLDQEDDEMLRLSLSAAYSCQNDTSQAINEAQEAVDLAPGNPIPKSTLMDLYLEELEELEGPRNQLFAVCMADIDQALDISNTTQWSSFIQQKQLDVQALADELLDLTMTLPMDLPEAYVSFSEAQERYLTRYQQSFADPLARDVDSSFNEWSDSMESLAQDFNDCCSAATIPCCDCQSHYCTGSWGVVENQVYPDAGAALERFLPGTILLFRDYELEVAGEIIRLGAKMSESSKDWSVRFNYNLLATLCKEIGLEVAYALELPLLTQDLAETNCDVAQACRTAEEEARQREQQIRAEEARRAAAEAAKKKAEAAQKAKDETIRGEVCLDSLGCLGVDGSKLSVKIGGGVFAQFSVDVDKLSVGVRVGVGLSDPTGGNLAGADLSVGGEIGAGGTSFDITHSVSIGAGTIRKDVSLYKQKFEF